MLELFDQSLNFLVVKELKEVKILIGDHDDAPGRALTRIIQGT